MDICNCATEVIGMFCNIVLAICGIIGVKTYFASDKRKKVVSAYKLAKYYKDNILDPASAICDLYELLKIDNIVNELDETKMLKFDSIELDELMQKKDQDKILNMSKAPEYINSVLLVSDMHNLKLNGATFKLENGKRVATVQDEILKCSVGSLRSDVLNSLEYFAMNFVSNVADENNVYQSLSQTYVQVVKYLYINIARNNVRGSHIKYFTNVISLFNTWVKKRQHDKKESDSTDYTRKISKV